MAKKITALLLTLLMCLSLLPIGVFAEEPYSGTCGEKLTWTLEDGTLTISGEGAMQDYGTDRPIQTEAYEATDAPWGKYYDKIVDVVIGDGVTKIGARAFWGCNKIKTVFLSNTVYSIDNTAFMTGGKIEKIEAAAESTYYCSENGILFSKDKTKLVLYPTAGTGEYTVPNTVTRIGEDAFRSCEGLTAVVIPATVTDIDSDAFFGCTGLKSLTLSEGLERIGSSAFQNCSALEYVTIPQSVTTVGDFAFAGCISLREARFLGHAPERFGVDVFANSAFADMRKDFHLLVPGNDETWVAKDAPYPTWNNYTIVFDGIDPRVTPSGFIATLINTIRNIFRTLFSWLPFFR